MADFALRAAGVSKRFGGRTVLEGFRLAVGRGEFVALTGPSGSGKSTALNIVGLIATPTTGRVEINGTDLAGARDVVRSRHRGRYISFVYQGFHLAPTLTVAENVELGVASQLEPTADPRTRVAEALEVVGVGHVAQQFPGTLSGGEQQRVAIARALARRTPLLLADEPTGNLDRGNADAIMALMEAQVAAGAALVLVTHDPAVAARADRVVELATPGGSA
ncbi:MAG: ABC transporter ATP-binding protein [Tessaracoccus sp.]|uniref:ABC transporter ATP-binding protein n=1 Tax=Tessaracoccus sp. TaxID=1971211 RepID=UPI001EC4311F|nr:ABC transporter ATP-binding protein [Tessaracoccus sp.]MBK7819635.1 ABC transporter ATP-binding protein [Tessaracoccus sp.]